MEGFIKQLIEVIVGSGNPAVVAILLLICAGACWFAFKRETDHKRERDQLIEKFQKQIDEDRKDLLGVLDRYREGQISVIQALNELKVLIATIGAKL